MVLSQTVHTVSVGSEHQPLRGPHLPLFPCPETISQTPQRHSGKRAYSDSTSLHISIVDLDIEHKKVVARIKFTNHGKTNLPECFDYHHLNQTTMFHLNSECGYSTTKEIGKLTKTEINKTTLTLKWFRKKGVYIHTCNV